MNYDQASSNWLKGYSTSISHFFCPSTLDAVFDEIIVQKLISRRKFIDVDL